MSTIINATTTNGVVIQPDNSGSLVLQTNSGTTALTIDTSQNATFAGTLTATGKLVASSMPTGSVLQVLQAVKTDTSSTTSSTYSDIPGLSVSITPSSTSNKILVTCSVMVGQDGGAGTAASVVIVRDATTLINPSSPGSRFPSIFNMESSISSGMQYMLMPAVFTYLDSPSSTSSLTYKVQFKDVVNAVGATYINRGGNDGNVSVVPRGVSTITVMEIKG
jgi:hypothetical protein